MEVMIIKEIMKMIVEFFPSSTDIHKHAKYIINKIAMEKSSK